MTSDTYRSSLVNFRGRDLLRQAITKYDSLPFYCSYWIVMSGGSLLFATGAALGSILQFRYPDNSDIVLTCAILAAMALLLLCIGVSFYYESVVERRTKLIETLESYMDAQADVAKYSHREAH
jgi:hypothetical protein